MKTTTLLATGTIVATLALAVVGCQTAPMTARSTLEYKEPLTSVERTTVVGTNGVPTITMREIKDSPAMGDFKLKQLEFEARTKASVAKSQRATVVVDPGYSNWGTGMTTYNWGGSPSPRQQPISWPNNNCQGSGFVTGPDGMVTFRGYPPAPRNGW